MEDIVKCSAKKYRNDPDHINVTINRTDRDMQNAYSYLSFLL